MFQYQYEITMHSVDKDGRLEYAVYRTASLIPLVAADGTSGRGSRIWTAHRVTTGTDQKTQQAERLVVIKDYWVDSDRQRAGDVVNHLRQRALEEIDSDDEQRAFLEHIPRTVHHDDVSTSGSHDQTGSFRDEGTSTYLGLSSSADPPIRHDIALPDTQTHYLVVFKDYPRPLHEVTSCHGAYFAIFDAMDSLALLHSMGRVHRDISPGNILLVHDGPDQMRGLLTDFVYANENGAGESSRMTRTGTEYFMSIEVDAHKYLFRPKAPSTVMLKPKPNQQKYTLGDLLRLKKDDILVLAQKPPPPLPFSYHPLNDWESIWWVAVYMVVNRIVDSRDESESKSIDEQREIARKLFHSALERRNFFLPDFSDLDDKLQSVLDPHMAKIMIYLVNIRSDLHEAYTEAEADPTRYPDVGRSLELITLSVSVNMTLICEYLEQEPRSALRIKPIPPKGCGKNVGKEGVAAVG